MKGCNTVCRRVPCENLWVDVLPVPHVVVSPRIVIAMKPQREKKKWCLLPAVTDTLHFKGPSASVAMCDRVDEKLSDTQMLSESSGFPPSGILRRAGWRHAIRAVHDSRLELAG